MDSSVERKKIMKQIECALRQTKKKIDKVIQLLIVRCEWEKNTQIEF